jgi:hypothetical protein
MHPIEKKFRERICACRRRVSEPIHPEFDKLTEDLLQSYVPQEIAMECIGMLRAAGMGKEGHANTLWDMVKDLTQLYRLEQKRTLCALLMYQTLHAICDEKTLTRWRREQEDSAAHLRLFGILPVEDSTPKVEN